MKLMFASDIHGSKYWCQKMMERFFAERPQRLVLLGDLLYHGPRNDLPKEYDPKGVIALLNSIKENIIAVRGNCDAEVDQMVLEFPIMADFAPILLEDGRLLFCTHGHIYHNDKLPPLQDGDLLMNGHTHVYDNRDMGKYRYLNPGSVSLPKEDCVNSYMIYHDGIFTLKDMDG
ncbi:MAG: phosphodiesterase, partial [Angelakisella sp.]